MKRKTITRIRRIYLLFSIAIGIISPLILCSFSPDFDPRVDPVSKFGILKNSAPIFTWSLVIFSGALLWNGMTIVGKFIKNSKYRFWLKNILIFSSINLFFTGIIPMDQGIWHQIPALCFFLAYNFFVFLFGVLRSLSYVRKGFISVITGSLMLLSYLLVIPFESYGVAELVYVLLIFFWNIIMWLRIIRINNYTSQ